MENFDFKLSYDDLADYIFTELIDLGYAPMSDEVLDIADFMMDFILMMFQNVGIEVFTITEEELGEDEE